MTDEYVMLTDTDPRSFHRHIRHADYPWRVLGPGHCETLPTCFLLKHQDSMPDLRSSIRIHGIRKESRVEVGDALVPLRDLVVWSHGGWVTSDFSMTGRLMSNV